MHDHTDVARREAGLEHRTGHDRHEGHSVAMFRDRFWLSLGLSVLVMAYSETVQEWFGFTPPQFPGADWVAPVLGTFIFVYGGRPFVVGGVRELGDRNPGMMLLISMAIIDAPALAQADVGIAIGAGTDVAIESAGIVLVSDDPRAVVSVLRLSRRAYRKMLQNLWWAAGYNIVAIPLAAGVLASFGVVLGPAAGAIAMSASTVVVALNAQLLRRLDVRAASA